MVTRLLSFLTALFIFLGVVFSLGKASFLIYASMLMSIKRKEKYNSKALCRFMGKIMFIDAFCIFLVMIGNYLGIKPLLNFGCIAIGITAVFAVVYLYTSKKLKK